MVLVRVTFSGTWYHSSSLAEQFTCTIIIVSIVTTITVTILTSGTLKWTTLSTSLHSCQVTGSQPSLPAHTCR